MSCIYTDENCLISSLSSHLVCGVREEALKPCSVALWTVAKLRRPWQNPVLCVGAAYRFISRAAGPLALASTPPLSACPFPTTCTPGTTSLCISSSAIHVPDTWARIELRRFVEGLCLAGVPRRGASPSTRLLRASLSSWELLSPPSPDPRCVWIIATLPAEVRD